MQGLWSSTKIEDRWQLMYHIHHNGRLYASSQILPPLDELINKRSVICLAKFSIKQKMEEYFRKHLQPEMLHWIVPLTGGTTMMVEAHSKEEIFKTLPKRLPPYISIAGEPVRLITWR